MIDLILSICCSSLIFVIFKLFQVFKINTFYAIVTNYIVASVIGFSTSPVATNFKALTNQPWFLITFALGILFISIFIIMAKSAQNNGVAVTSVATKMSLVIPVLFGVFYYSETLNFWQIIGVFMALLAVCLTSVKKNGLRLKKEHIYLPVLVFLGSGVIDCSINFIKEGYLNENQFSLFSATVFGAAAFIGLIVILFKFITKGFIIAGKNILAGMALGIPNFFSIYFLLRALNNPDFFSATIFTVNNVAIVICSTLLGIIFFKEKLSPKNWLGILLASVSIVLVSLF